MNTLPASTEKSAPADLPTWLKLIQKEASTLRFGIIQIVIHDSRVVQIETTQKLRIEAHPPKSS